MSNFRDYDRSQRLVLPADLCDWVADDDLAHFIVASAERVDLSAFHVSRTGNGKAQYHPRMMLALLIYCYASGIFSSRRIERATYRDVSVRFIAANTHPDHDTIAVFRRRNAKAFALAFEQVLLLASEAGLLKVGAVSVDGTKLDANALKIKSIRYDRIQALRQKLAEDIAELMVKAEAADMNPQDDGLSLPEEIARREVLKEKLDVAARRLEEAQARDHDDDDTPPPPPAADKLPKAIATPWRLEMMARLKTEPAKSQYKKRKQSVEPVFGIIKSILGFSRFNLRGIEKIKAEWKLVTLAYNCKRLAAMRTPENINTQHPNRPNQTGC
ncbi:transposase [Pelagibacterium halotolerans]|uniref:transposase n=1 Tax=Pelagibacterium halotolerans TaxID=531813 RepID=UPI00384DBA6E